MDVVGSSDTVEILSVTHFPELQGVSSTGRHKTWSIYVEGPEYTIVSGYATGAKTITKRYVLGKNIGKSNETTPHEQAILEATARWKKQQDDKGYRLTLAECSKDEGIYPMRAGYYDKNKGKLTFPCYLQPKLNGIKLIADGLLLQTRTGKPFGASLKHIGNAVKKLNCPFPLDGELYIHGAHLNDISAATKKDNPLSDKLEYWVYDLVEYEEVQGTRIAILRSALSSSDGVCVRACPTMLCHSEEELDKWHEHYVSLGYEGTIIRDVNALYKKGPTRSSCCLKRKDFKDEEFEIVGTKKDVNGCVIFICSAVNGSWFDCVPKGTDEQRKQWYVDSNSFTGKLLTVRYLTLSKYGIPEGNPVGLCVRDYE